MARDIGSELNFKRGMPDAAEAVGVTLELYREFGFDGDLEEMADRLLSEFTELSQLGYEGLLYAQAPDKFSFKALLKAVENRRSENVRKATFYEEFWSRAITERMLNKGPSEALASMALLNAGHDSTMYTGSVFHYTNKPVTEECRWWEQRHGETAVDLLAKDNSEFSSAHKAFKLEASDHRDALVLAGMDRIRGVSHGNIYRLGMGRGYLKIPKLVEPSQHTRASVGTVSTMSDGQLRFSSAYGYEDREAGIGVSIRSNG